MSNYQPATSEILISLTSKGEEGKISLQQITSALEDRGLYFLLLLFSLPMALPLPYPPGFSSVVSLPLLFFSFQAALGLKTVYMPDFVSRQTVSSHSLTVVVNKTLPFLRKMEGFLKPSIPQLFNPKFEQCVGIFCLILAGCIALPLSMLSNTIPGAGIAIMSLAIIQRDGRMLLGGALVGLVGLLVTLLVVYSIIKAVLFVGAHV